MAIDPLVFKIDGDAVGAVKAIEEVTKKVDGLRSKEAGLQAALAGVNTTTEEGKRVFAQLKAELDVVENKMLKFNAASDGLKNISKDLNDRVGKFSGIVSSLGQVAGTSGGKIAEMANAGASLAQAFAMGGGMAAGIAAVTIALGKLNDGLSTYIDRASVAETKRITGSVAGIVAASTAGRDASSRIQELREQLGIITEVDKIRAEIDAVGRKSTEVGAKFASIPAEGLSPEQRAERDAAERSLLNLGEQRRLLLLLLDQELAKAEQIRQAEHRRLEEEQKITAEKAEQVRLQNAFDFTAPTTGGDDELVSFGALTGRDNAAGAKLAHMSDAAVEARLIADAFADVPDVLIEAAEHITTASEKWQTTGDRFASALADMAGLLANPSIAGALTGNASSLGGIGSMVGGALGPAGAAVGGMLGSTLGDGLGRLIDKLNPFGEIVSSIGNVMMSLEPIWVITATNANALAGAFDVLAGVVRIGAEIIALLQVPLRVVGQLFTDLTPDMGDFSESLSDAADRINQAARFFAGGIADVINAVIDGINFVMRQMNERFGTDLPMISKVVVADMFSVSEAAAEAGEAIRENLTDEFVNLPAGFKTNGAIFSSTAPGAGPSGSGAAGITIGVVNVTARGTLLDELKSLQDRAGIGSSSIIGGRNSISDRRN